MSSLDAEHLKEDGKHSTQPNKFAEWFNSPSKSFIYAYMFIVITSVFVSVILFSILGASSLLYARKLKKREDSDVIALMASYLSAIGKLCIRFVITTLFLAFIIFSLYSSTTVPPFIVNNSLYLVPFPILFLLLAFISNAIRMHLGLPPMTRLLDPVRYFLVWLFRFSKKLVRNMWLEFKAKS